VDHGCVKTGRESHHNKENWFAVNRRLTENEYVYLSVDDMRDVMMR